MSATAVPRVVVCPACGRGVRRTPAEIGGDPRVAEALEVLGGLVSRAGGEGDWALDVVKDALALRGVAA